MMRIKEHTINEIPIIISMHKFKIEIWSANCN